MVSEGHDEDSYITSRGGADTFEPGADPLTTPGSSERGGAGRTSSPRLTWWVASFLALVIVAAAVVLVVELVSLRPRYDQINAEQRDRADAVRVAEQFMVQFNTYSYQDMGSYKRSLDALLSTKAQASFKAATNQTAQLVKAAKLKSKGEVLASGVSSIDPDSANVLVVGDAAATTSAGVRARHFRWQVALVKVNGQWLVDDFQGIS
jgi:hypothetical protein